MQASFSCFAKVCSLTPHSHFPLLGVGARGASHMLSSCLPSRDGACGSPGRVEGLKVPAQALQLRSSSLPSPVPEGLHGAEWGWHPSCTQEKKRLCPVGQNVAPGFGMPLISFLASFECRNLGWRDSVADIPQLLSSLLSTVQDALSWSSCPVCFSAFS